jgi:hypothetical protein
MLDLLRGIPGEGALREKKRQSNAPATLTEEDYVYEVLMQAAMKAIERFGE